MYPAWALCCNRPSEVVSSVQLHLHLAAQSITEGVKTNADSEEEAWSSQLFMTCAVCCRIAWQWMRRIVCRNGYAIVDCEDEDLAAIV